MQLFIIEMEAAECCLRTLCSKLEALIMYPHQLSIALPVARAEGVGHPGSLRESRGGLQLGGHSEWPNPRSPALLSLRDYYRFSPPWSGRFRRLCKFCLLTICLPPFFLSLM